MFFAISRCVKIWTSPLNKPISVRNNAGIGASRGLVDDQAEDTLGAAILSKAMQGGWAQSMPAARELTEVAVACVKGVSARTTPAQVLGRVEALAHGQREPASQQSW